MKEQEKNMHALIIGVGDDLPGTVKDANKLHEILIDKELGGYPKDQVIILTNEEASREGVLQGFAKLRKNTNEHSTILLYYSGHGRDGDKDFWLQLNGYKAGKNNNYLYAGDLVKEVNSLASNRLVLFLDCCKAEGMTEGISKKLEDEGGMFVISSCQDDQLSWQLPNHTNSLFTECLIEVLTGKHRRDFSDPRVSVMDAMEHIFEEVPKRAHTVINPKTKAKIVQQPFARVKMNANHILSYFPKNAENHEATIKKLLPNVDELDEGSLKKLIRALDIMGQSDEAIAILEKHKKIKNDSDLLQVLGDLYKSKNLNNGLQVDAESAFKCYTKALKLASKTKDREQVFLNAIDLAFFHLKLDKSKKDMRNYAKQAKDVAKKYHYDNVAKFTTIAQANLYLGKPSKAKKFYRKAFKNARVIEKFKMQTTAKYVYKNLYNDNDKDDFITFLDKN